MLAKHWRAGEVKTRLAAAIGAERAAALYREFVSLLTRRLASVGDRRALAFSPPDARTAFAELAGSHWQLVEQSEGDLGQRMRRLFEELPVAPDSRVVLIGSDSPTLPVECVNEAFERLHEVPVVLGPTDDGGYYLVGAMGCVPPIFSGVPWGTAEVWDRTVRLLHDAGTRFATLPPWYDVDDVDDLVRLRDDAAKLPHLVGTWTDLLGAVRAALPHR